jgi:MoaA/NifB/PqqE/SkfB family radical SAM enzyme
MRLVGLGQLCNNACVFCAQAGRGCVAPGAGPSEVVHALEAAARGGQAVAFVGGEPTLEERLVRYAQQARALGAPCVLVQTNGRRLAYASYARALAGAGVGALDISLHGATAAMHDWHTAVEGSFAQTARGIANAVAAGIEVGVTCVATRSNGRHLGEVARVARSLGASAVRVRPVVVAGRAARAPLRLAARPRLLAVWLREAQSRGALLELEPGSASGPCFAHGGPFVDFVSWGAVGARAERDDGLAPRGPAGEPGARARPGAGERRERERRTGTALREILPELFGSMPEAR